MRLFKKIRICTSYNAQHLSIIYFEFESFNRTQKQIDSWEDGCGWTRKIKLGRRTAAPTAHEDRTAARPEEIDKTHHGLCILLIQTRNNFHQNTKRTEEVQLELRRVVDT